MDLAYNPHAERARRKNRSSTNIKHLSLAPLTAKLPINTDDDDNIEAVPFAPSRSTSYLQGKSAPTTPRLLSRSPAGPRSRSHHRTPSAPGLPVSKSKSTTHLGGAGGRRHATGTSTPGRSSIVRVRDDASSDFRDRSDSDWLLRTGAIMSTETREYKGQAWLVSRQSSTSLAAMRDDDDEAFERELALEREMASQRGSRRGSSALVGEDDAASLSRGSRFNSRYGSRSHSVAGARNNALTPLGRDDHDSYFVMDHTISGPDFVNLDEKLEELERDDSQADEAAVRRLVRHGQNGRGSWISNMIGWSLFSLEENDEDDEEDEDDSLADATSQGGRSGWSARHFEGVSNVPEEKMPPPEAGEGAWSDAAWLLSVATKVMF